MAQGNIKSLVGSIGTLLLNQLAYTDTNISVPNISKYTYFIAEVGSTYWGGIAVGKKISNTLIRFMAVSGANTGGSSGVIDVNISGDTIVNVQKIAPQNSSSLTKITGLF